MTGEQVRWGLENLALDQKKLDALGFAGVMRPISTSCADHMGSTWARIQTWDGAKWSFTSDCLPGRRADHQADGQGRGGQVRSEKKLTRRTLGRLPELSERSARRRLLPPQPLPPEGGAGPAGPLRSAVRRLKSRP